jgi:formylmethanofuran dehydrogenase subunit E
VFFLIIFYTGFEIDNCSLYQAFHVHEDDNSDGIRVSVPRKKIKDKKKKKLKKIKKKKQKKKKKKKTQLNVVVPRMRPQKTSDTFQLQIS